MLSSTVFTVAEAARRVQVHEETIRRAYRRRELGHTRIGRMVRIPEEALERWLRNAEIPAKK